MKQEIDAMRGTGTIKGAAQAKGAGQIEHKGAGPGPAAARKVGRDPTMTPTRRAPAGNKSGKPR